MHVAIELAASTDLLLVVKTFVIVVPLRNAFPFTLVAHGVCVHHIAGQQVLPEWKALGKKRSHQHRPGGAHLWRDEGQVLPC